MSPCQFSFEPKYRFAERDWCALHLPITDESGTQSEKASWSPQELAEHVLQPISRIVADATAASQTANLRFIVVPGMTVFRGSGGPNAVDFGDAVFSGKTFFQGWTFAPGTSFRHAVFRDRADFRGSSFAHDADFSHATFGDIAQFMGIDVSGDLYLFGASFSEYADFENAKFGNKIVLDRAVFAGDARFQINVEIEARRDIAELRARMTTFKSTVLFTNRAFRGTTWLRDATFHVAPDFHGCELHQATFFPPASGFLDTTSENAAERYRTLAQAMADMRAREAEAMFFALQQRAARKKRHWFDPVRWVSVVYDYASDYGQSIWRPLVLLAMSFVAFPAIYAAIGARAAGSFWYALGAGYGFAFEQLFNPFGVWKTWSTWAGRLATPGAGWLVALGTVQTLVALVLLYFLALGIRWRFRRW